MTFFPRLLTGASTTSPRHLAGEFLTIRRLVASKVGIRSTPLDGHVMLSSKLCEMK